MSSNRRISYSSGRSAPPEQQDPRTALEARTKTCVHPPPVGKRLSVGSAFAKPHRSLPPLRPRPASSNPPQITWMPAIVRKNQQGYEKSGLAPYCSPSPPCSWGRVREGQVHLLRA